MLNPLSTRRYTELVDRINGSFGLIRKYLELKIKVMEQDLEDRLTLEQTRQIVKDFADDLLLNEPTEEHSNTAINKQFNKERGE
jgi:hypothetical protein